MWAFSISFCSSQVFGELEQDNHFPPSIKNRATLSSWEVALDEPPQMEQKMKYWNTHQEAAALSSEMLFPLAKQDKKTLMNVCKAGVFHTGVLTVCTRLDASEYAGTQNTRKSRR